MYCILVNEIYRNYDIASSSNFVDGAKQWFTGEEG